MEALVNSDAKTDDLFKDVDDLTYLLDYLIVKYNISDIDASILENSATLEKFILSTPDEIIRDDDELEFF